jgi:hypothetical protein
VLTALLHRPLRLLLVLATVLCAVGVATGSGATFSSRSATAGNAFVSGTLLQTNSRSGAAVLSASGMRPGDTATGDVRITNGGTLPATFRLSETAAVNAFTAGSMTVRVVDVASSTVVYDGDVGGLGTKTLAPFAAGEARTFRFTATLSASAPPADQGKTARAGYVWNAVPTAAAGGSA